MRGSPTTTTATSAALATAMASARSAGSSRSSARHPAAYERRSPSALASASWIDVSFVDTTFAEALADRGSMGALHRGHREVEAGAQRRRAIVDGAPVAQHETVEAPFSAEDPFEERDVLACVGSVDQVVRAHHRE